MFTSDEITTRDSFSSCECCAIFDTLCRRHVGQYGCLYDGVFSRHPDVLPVEEKDDIGFAETLLRCVESIFKDVEESAFICLCVDDLIFIDKVDLRCAYKLLLLEQILSENDEIFF